jgi:hypothetical protein
LAFAGFLCALPSAALAQQIGGIWTDGKYIFDIDQNGGNVTLRTGQEFRGTLAGGRLTVTTRLTDATVRKDRPDWVRRKLIGQTVSIVGTVRPDGNFIDAQYLDKDVKWEQKDTVETLEPVHDVAVPLRLTRLEVTARWEEPAATMGAHLKLSGFTETLAAVRYTGADTSVNLILDGKGVDLSQSVVDISLTNRLGSSNPNGSPAQPIHVSPPYAGVAFDPALGVTRFTFKANDILTRLSAQINRDALSATVMLQPAAAGRMLQPRTTNILHVFRQKLIVFLPGVCGSVIWVRPDGTAASEVEAFPRWSKGDVPANVADFRNRYLLLLRMNPDGTPCSTCAATKLDLFRSYGVGSGASVNVLPLLSPAGRFFKSDTLVYDVERMQALKKPQGHPTLLDAGGTEVPYYVLAPWPYDWRGRLEDQVRVLMGSGGGDAVDPPYASPPTLAHILEVKKKTYQFLDDKIALAGHSTGGVIMRGLLSQPGVEALVDKAYFIDTPNWGAPKAYFVFLTGDMGIPFLGEKLMQFVAPNMPIVYYLSPTLDYPEPFVRSHGTEVPRQDNIGGSMSLLVQDARSAGLYPAADAGWGGWNDGLEKSAAAYFAGIHGNPMQIGWQNTLAFVSSMPAAKGHTIGMVWVDRAGVHVGEVAGDGTVPIVSQRADFPKKQIREIPGSPLHAEAANQEFVWQTIVDDLIVPQ